MKILRIIKQDDLIYLLKMKIQKQNSRNFLKYDDYIFHTLKWRQQGVVLLLKSDWQECELIKLETFSKIRKKAQEPMNCVSVCVFALKNYMKEIQFLYKEDSCGISNKLLEM